MNITPKRGPFFPELLSTLKAQKTKDPQEEIKLYQATERLYNSGFSSHYSWKELCLLISVTKTSELILNLGSEEERVQYRRVMPIKKVSDSSPIRRLKGFLESVGK